VEELAVVFSRVNSRSPESYLGKGVAGVAEDYLASRWLRYYSDSDMGVAGGGVDLT